MKANLDSALEDLLERVIQDKQIAKGNIDFDDLDPEDIEFDFLQLIDGIVLDFSHSINWEEIKDRILTDEKEEKSSGE